jgi:hypothetical protein
MTKRPSDKLADLSYRAKSAEDALDAVDKEAHDRIVARKEQAHAAATKVVEEVNQEVESANDTANRNWSAVKAKIADDMKHLKANIAHAKHEHDVNRAENRADRLEWSPSTGHRGGRRRSLSHEPQQYASGHPAIAGDYANR